MSDIHCMICDAVVGTVIDGSGKGYICGNHTQEEINEFFSPAQ